MEPLYRFKLPPEEDVIKRNRTITTYYAQLYRNEPLLYKWAGMAAFASFHIGEKLKIWDWETTKIKSFAESCKKKNRSIEDDFQIIRIINNKIFSEIGSTHLAFCQLDYNVFKRQLIDAKKSEIILQAFDKLNAIRTTIKTDGITDQITNQIWEANIDILWHEQSKVVQPLFDKLSYVFSGAMSFIASFDYSINHKKTNWKVASRFITYMIFNGFKMIRKSHFLPDVTDLDQRWFWISNDLVNTWRIIESTKNLISEEIKILSELEERNLKITSIKTGN